MIFMTFHINWEYQIIIPTDFHIFQRGRLNHQPDTMSTLGVSDNVLHHPHNIAQKDVHKEGPFQSTCVWMDIEDPAPGFSFTILPDARFGSILQNMLWVLHMILPWNFLNKFLCWIFRKRCGTEFSLSPPVIVNTSWKPYLDLIGLLNFGSPVMGCAPWGSPC